MRQFVHDPLDLAHIAPLRCFQHAPQDRLYVRAGPGDLGTAYM
ncbi:MAG: hypothetical protein ABSD28_13180 [Tepidisphaeraceae bacterium]